MNKLLENKKVINIAVNVLLIVLFVVALAPFFITTKYALFVTDDFPIANAAVSNFDGSYFRTGVKCAANYWHVWNGNWFSFTIAYWLHPIIHGGQEALVIALRIQLLLAVSGAFYFCYSLASFFGFKAEKTLRIALVVVLPVLLFKEYFDLYLWWLTSCTYLMPLYCFFFGFGTYLFALKNKKMWQFIVAGVFLLAMSGGSLNVVGLGCYTLLFALVAWSAYKKEICIPAVVVFVITLIGACLNAFAPGSFSRQDLQGTEKIGVIKAIIREIQILGVEGKWLLLHTAFLAFVFVAFFWGSRLNKKISFVNLIVASAFCVLLPVVTMFPVILGYGDITYKDISNRGCGMMDISILFGACFMAVLWGIYLKTIIKGNSKKLLAAVLVVAALGNLLICGQKFSELAPVQIAKNLGNGYNEEFFKTWMEIYSLCENSDEDNLVIEMSVPKKGAGCSWAKLSDDPEKWWNTSISEYYGLDSLILVNLSDQ